MGELAYVLLLQKKNSWGASCRLAGNKPKPIRFLFFFPESARVCEEGAEGTGNLAISTLNEHIDFWLAREMYGTQPPFPCDPGSLYSGKISPLPPLRLACMSSVGRLPMIFPTRAPISGPVK